MKEIKVALGCKESGYATLPRSRLGKRWPWKSGTVSEAVCSHVLHKLKPAERRHFVHELHRVLKKDAQARIVVPHWCASKYYLEPEEIHWPPVAEYWLFSLDKTWRDTNMPKSSIACDFHVGIGYGMHPAIVPKQQEAQHHALSFFKEAAQDMLATLTKR